MAEPPIAALTVAYVRAAGNFQPRAPSLQPVEQSPPASPLECVVTKNVPVSPLEYVLTKTKDLKSPGMNSYDKAGWGGSHPCFSPRKLVAQDER